MGFEERLLRRPKNNVAAGVSWRTNLCRLTAAATSMEERLPRRPVKEWPAWNPPIKIVKISLANNFFGVNFDSKVAPPSQQRIGG